MSYSAEKIHLIAGIVRRGYPDKKQAIPTYQYVERHHVSKGRFWRLTRAAEDNVTLTLIHVVIPRVCRYKYSAAVHERFQLWIRPRSSATLVEMSSLVDILRYAFFADNKCPYFFSIHEFTSSDLAVDAENTFGAQIVRYQLNIQVIWGYVKEKYTDSMTLAEMTRYRALHAHERRRLQWARVHQRQLAFREHLNQQIAMREAEHRARRLSVMLGASETNTPGNSPARVQASSTPAVPTVNSRQRSLSAHAESSRMHATAVCFCCYEEKPMHVLNCGHICCKTCIEMNVTVTRKRLCYMCKTEWTFHRPVDISSVLPHVVCDVCNKPTVYIMICGHASCECPHSVCSKCNTGARIRAFV